jgi:hypothetical protein
MTYHKYIGKSFSQIHFRGYYDILNGVIKHDTHGNGFRKMICSWNNFLSEATLPIRNATTRILKPSKNGLMKLIRGLFRYLWFKNVPILINFPIRIRSLGDRLSRDDEFTF